MSDLIKHFEDCRLTVYADSAGLPTVGVGHLVRPEDNLKLGDKITQEQADRLLDLDLYDAEMRVKKAIPDLYYTLTQNEKEALISLAFNLRSFETLVNHLRKDKELFKKKMLLYCRDVEKNYLKGLKVRRIAERLLFEGRDWTVAKDLQRKPLSEILEEEKKLFT